MLFIIKQTRVEVNQMSEKITYIATNTDLQVIDSFDPGVTKALSYIIQIDNKDDVSMVQLKAVHDGVTVGTTQQGMTVADIAPVSFSANIVNFEGKVYVTPSVAPSTFVLDKTEILANNYAEHTRCGRWIKHTEGFAYNSNTVVVRQSNNNVFASPSVYLVSNTLGPIEDGPNLLANPNLTDNSGWTPYNDVVFSNNVITSNNVYKNNFIYQKIQIELGHNYRASANGSGGSLVVSSTLSETNYINGTLTSNIAQQFTPKINSDLYLSVGHTNVSNTFVYTVGLFKFVPFNTYRSDIGTFYYSWSNTAANTVLWKMLNIDGHSRELRVNANGQVQITENTSIFVVGPQASGVNKIAFSYGNGFSASLNGNSVVSDLNIQIIDNMLNLEFVTNPQQFSYVPSVLSNTEVIDLAK